MPVEEVATLECVMTSRAVSGPIAVLSPLVSTWRAFHVRGLVDAHQLSQWGLRLVVMYSAWGFGLGGLKTSQTM